jgi:CheY-like chemotaxis protein
VRNVRFREYFGSRLPAPPGQLLHPNRTSAVGLVRTNFPAKALNVQADFANSCAAGLFLSLPIVQERPLRVQVHVVDDDASFRTAMERRLTQAAYEVATYPSAHNLLDRLPSESVPGCILLDVRIPGLSGPEPQERLSKIGSMLPIIFITGYPDHGADHQSGRGRFSDQARFGGRTISRD